MIRISLFLLSSLFIVGCIDIFPPPPPVCEPLGCEIGVDVDGDGCIDTCGESECFDDNDCIGSQVCIFGGQGNDEPPTLFEADEAQLAPERRAGGVCVAQCGTDGDAALREPCPDGSEYIDTDGDGCVDSCSTLSCFEDSECRNGQRCDIENFCDAPPGCDAEEGCDAVCAGRCVDDVVCPDIDFDCGPNGVLVDVDGDGCPDFCEEQCEFAIDCAPGSAPVDIDGDGCDDLCEPVGCPEIALPICEEGFVLTDTDGDGCLDTCEPVACPAIEILCEEGFQPADTNGDGCVDGCEEIICEEELLLDCAPGFEPVDTDGDDCADSCEEIVCLLLVELDCPDDSEAVDTDGDGCEDTCVPVDQCEAIPVCDEGHEEIDSTDQCLQDASCYTRTLCGTTILCTG